MADFLDVFQNKRINKNQNDAADSRRHANRALQSADELRSDLDRLTLACQAMWELLRDGLGVTEEQLATKIREVDLRSGMLDGKPAAAPNECVACGRTVNARHATCLYCGAEMSANPLAG